MHALAQVQTVGGARSLRLPDVLLAGGCLNGLVVRLVEGASSGGTSSLTFGLGPFEIIVCLAALRLILRSREDRRTDAGWPEIVALAIFLLPSSAVSWAGLAFYAGIEARRTLGERRTGALLLLGLAVCSLWSSVFLKWLAAPVTTAEAVLIGQIAHVLRPEIVQHGNVIGNGAHSLILMTACTNADGVPPALLALVAVATMVGTPDRRRIAVALPAMAFFYVVTNTARLVAMTLSPESYDLVHGPVGANIFDGMQTATVVGLAAWASRP